uniref:Cytochrome c oxidase subunit 3 n=1 Tax=Oligolophus tienmushanensis TaxID=1508515 RepID=A0A140X728_9ARAC|nr:cytochrome c oxidase subunit III [Oligolophus tienmushanensis]AIG60113.1 cytochrome c oxidase subunit III [Oligolophus tienmushanensis]
MKNFHPFHIVDQSPWPLTAALGSLFLTSGMASWIHIKSPLLIMLGLMILIITSYQWWRDISRESTLQGNHTKKVMMGLQWGMILFIVSEVLFFVSFFWAFLHSSLSPNIEIGMMWPPKGIEPFNPMQIPLLNTTILISSGISITWTHHSILNNNLTQAKKSLMMTILLGVYFTMLQGWEYMEAPFSVADSIYGSTFFISTGFHGLHVIVGTTFLFITMMRLNKLHFSMSHHFGFEAAAWYWHFVDVVWLLLYSLIYWWGG